MSSVNFEAYNKKVVDFREDKLNMATNLTMKKRGSYTNDTEHGKAVYTDENMLAFNSSESLSELNEQEKELRKKVLEKMKSRYFCRV